MKTKQITKINNPISLTNAAKRLQISELSVWILVRQNIVPICLNHKTTHVDYDALYKWSDHNKDAMTVLHEERTVNSPNPLFTLFA